MFEKKSELRTKLAQTLQELEACEARWRAIISKSPHGILIVDAGQTIRFANQAATAIFGCRTEELLGEHFEVPAISDKPSEMSMKSRDGRTVAVEMWRIETEWRGEPAWLVALHDVTERKHGEQELRKLYRAMTGSPSMVMITDARGNIEYVNPKFTEVSGYTAAEAAGQNPRFLKSSKVPPEVYRELWETILAGREWRGEMVNRKKNGELYWEFAAISPVTDFEGNITNFIAVTEDITERKKMEEALRDSEALFRIIFDQAFQLMGLMKPDGTLIRMNRTAADFIKAKGPKALGKPVPFKTLEPLLSPSRDEEPGVIGKLFWETPWWVHSPELQERLRDAVRRANQGEVVRFEATHLTSEGNTVWVDFSLTPVMDEKGDVVLLVPEGRDITERKVAEEALRESEERFRATFDQAAVGIAHLDMDGRLLRINRKYCEIVGYAEEELKKLTFQEITHPDDLEVSIEQFKLLRAGKIGDFSLEKRYIRKNGSPVWVNLTASMVCGPNGEPRYTVSIIENITRRKLAEQALHESEEKFSRAFRAVPNLLLVATLPYEMYVEVNEAFERTCGYLQQEVHGGRLEEFDIWADPADRVKVIRDLQEQGSLRDLEIKFKDRGGKVFTGLLSAELIELCGIKCMVCIISDITERKRVEEALHLEKNFADTVINSMPGIFYVFDDNGRLVRWNRKHEEILGRLPEEMAGLRPSDAMAEENRELAEAKLREVLFERHTVDAELLLLDREGRKIPFYCTGAPMTVGDRTYAVGMGIDITERKLAEEALRESEELFRATFNQVAVGIGHVDPAGRWLRVNQRYCDILGYTEEELKALSIREITHPDDLETSMKQFQLVLDGKLGNYSLDKRYIRKDGSPVWVNLTVSAVYDAGGNLKFMVGVTEDISARKRAEEARQESEERFRAIFEQAAVGIGEMGADGRWLRANRKMCDILGYTEEELRGLAFWEITHPHDLEPGLGLFRQTMAGTLPGFSMVKRYIRKDGSIVWANLAVAHVGGKDGAPPYNIAIMEDITPRKRAEEEIEELNTDLAARAAELESANRELEAFNYSVAHDLRKPLTVINGYCQAIMELCGDSIDQQCAAYLRETYNGTLRMNHLIDALLDFSRLARCEIKPETVDISAMARDIAVELRVAEPERPVTFVITEGVTAEGDPALLRLVMENLLGNAWKYTGRQEEAVIEFGVTEVEGKPACYVRDNGAGFDMAYAEKLFIPFQRLPGADEFRGHGIGLATVDRIIRRHKGRVWAEGEPGKGATFWFTLP